jgi:tetratricopeptide (TPR) repeat protein
VEACSNCSSADQRWQTLPLSRGLVELSRCGSCKTEQERVQWTIATAAPVGNNCMQCGGHYKSGICLTCGLTPPAALALHQQILLSHGGTDFLDGAQQAGAAGRLLVALKLATAAVHMGPRPPAAWVLRVRLLRALELNEEAVEDARELCRAQPQWGQAFAELALSLESEGRGGARAAADLALSMDDELPDARALRARLLYANNRFGAARLEAVRVLCGPPSRAREQALSLMIQYVRRLMELGEVASMRELLDSLGKDVMCNGELLALLAWQRWRDGHIEEARAVLDQADSLLPHQELVASLRHGPLAAERGFWSWLST